MQEQYTDWIQNTHQCIANLIRFQNTFIVYSRFSYSNLILQPLKNTIQITR